VIDTGRTALDELLKALAWAPSIHNTQPWLVDVAPGYIDIHPDRSRLLAVLDPAGRELMVSVGAAVFGLRAAMFRLRPYAGAGDTTFDGRARGHRPDHAGPAAPPDRHGTAARLGDPAPA
jgi:hypothetical protein